MNARMLTGLIFAAAALSAAAREAGATWLFDPSQNVLVASSTVRAGMPAAVADGAGGAGVAWWDSRNDPDGDVYATHLLADGTLDPAWPAGGLAVCTVTGPVDELTAVSDGAGGMVVVWRDQRSGNADVYALRVTSAGVLHPGWAAGGGAVCTAAGHQSSLQAVADGSGGVFIAWQDERDGDWDVYAQHVTGDGPIAAGWPANGRAVASSATPEHMPRIVADGSGGVLIAWTHGIATAARDIRALRVLANGSLDPAWPSGGLAVCAAVQDQFLNGAAPDGAGGMLLAWLDLRVGGVFGDTLSVFAHRVQGNGTLASGWPVDGREVRREVGGSLDEIPLVPDGSGGAFVAWVDPRVNGFDQAYAHHVTSNGAVDPRWTANGRKVFPSALASFYTYAIPDGSGGMIVGATIASGPGPYYEYDLHAQRIDAAGVLDPNWGDGVVVSNAAAAQFMRATFPSDGAGGAILVWEDQRAFSYPAGARVYAQRVDADGRLGPLAPTITGVQDVPGDQGGGVHVFWDPSPGDVAPYRVIRSYTVWRRLTEAAASARLASGAARLLGAGMAAEAHGVRAIRTGAATTWWEFVDEVPALGLQVYVCTAPTDEDAVAGDTPWCWFFVDAADSARWYASAIDSGYSVDNLAPHFPAPCFGWYADGSTRLQWPPNAEPDFAVYRLYRLATLDDPIGPETQIATLTDTGYVDSPGGSYYYAINSVDVHGNSSPNGLIVPFGTAGLPPGDLPRSVALLPVRPNPARGPATLQFALPAVGHATLAIYDAAGRRVRTLACGVRPAGMHRLEWNLGDEGGAPVAPGLYFARLEAGAEVRLRRFAVVR
jgi:hypothetical protein